MGFGWWNALPMEARARPGGQLTPMVVECATTVDGQPRVHRLAQEPGPKGPRWVIAVRPGDRSGPWIGLALPGATPVFAPGSATLTYRGGSGGIIVELRAATTSTLDVYVSYEVEVNVNAALSPSIDELNTHGVLAAACRVEGGADRDRQD
jgi:hypothetical protein